MGNESRKPKLVIGGTANDRLTTLALWCSLNGGLLLCIDEKEAARVQTRYGIRAVSSTVARPFGTHRGNVAIHDLWKHERARALLADAMIATSGKGAEVVCSMDDWFEIVGLEEFYRSLGLGDGILPQNSEDEGGE